MRPVLATLGFAVMLSVWSHPAAGQWSTDPDANNPIADRPSEQVLPKIGLRADGGCYVAWFDLSFGGYRVYMQSLDPFGRELWPHNGIEISAHPQSSSLVDWDLSVDTAGHAVVVFTDTRAGADLDVYAYRVSPGGVLEWGADGIALSANGDYEPSPQCAALTDGASAFVWPRLPDGSDGRILVQKILADGTLLFNPPIEIAGAPGEDPAFCAVVPAENGGFIVSYVRDIGTFQSPRHLKAIKFDAFGGILWGPVSVYDAASMPIAYMPITLPDGAGGAVFGWHRSASNLYNSMVQHLTSAGVERFPHNGVLVSTTPNTHHIDPTVAYDPAADEIFVFWTPRNPNQTAWGLSAQKISPTGARMWGEGGASLLPINAIWKGLPRCAALGGGAVVLYFDEPTGSVGQDRIMAMRLGGDGSVQWGGVPVPVSSLLSDKARLPIAMRGDGVTIGVWEDNRNGTVDLFGQSLNPDGTLGVNIQAVPEDPLPVRAFAAYPNPFHSTVRFRMTTPVTGAFLRIWDPSGREVARFRADEPLIRWSAEQIANGVYHYGIDGIEETGRIVLIR